MESYTLVITEKPDAAARIAQALDVGGKAEKNIDKGVPFYVARRNKEIVVVPALGHLYTVDAAKKNRSSYPIFEYKWAPLCGSKRRAKQNSVWIDTVSRLAKNADVFVDACDFDIEGSIIGYNILKYACGGKESTAKRMRYSTLTRDEIEKAYLEPLPTLDFCLIEAGLTRHEVDWLYGVNLSRALTTAAKNFSRQYSTLSTGRVQGPTLKFIAWRERNIRSFVPTPYWNLKTVVSVGGSVLEIDYEKKKIDVRDEAEYVAKACKGKDGTIKTIKITKYQHAPPPPFDLSTLQSESYKLFRYIPMQTSRVAQRLYLDALISYPRTDSQKLPPTIGYKSILEQLLRSSEHKKLATELLAKPRLKPKQGKSEDPAHPAIYPTGNLPERVLSNAERNIWNLIIRRFMASFGKPAFLQNVKATIEVEGHRFNAEGMEILEDGWISYYSPYMRSVTKFLPPMKEGEEVIVKRIAVVDKFTQPPVRYNPSTILKKMQKEKIGTKATRATIIQTLYDRRYIREEKIEATDLGFEVVDVLARNCLTVVSPNLTRILEEKMIMIQQQKETKENVIKEVTEILKPVMEKLKSKEQTIGEQLSQALKRSRIEERVIGPCPTCKTGKLIVVQSRKKNKRFVGCTGYFEGRCKTAFPLPQRGYIEPSGVCRRCGWSKVLVLVGRKRPWNLCLNPKCPSKKKEVTASEM